MALRPSLRRDRLSEATGSMHLTATPLKANEGFVRIKVEEVLKPIFMRGLLSLNEQQIAWYVIADSWRWEGRNVTEHPIVYAAIARETGIPRQHVQRTWHRLVARRVILELYRRSDRRLVASFNEHWETWSRSQEAGKEPNWDGNQIGARPKLVTACNQNGDGVSPNRLHPYTISRTSKNSPRTRTTSGETASRPQGSDSNWHQVRSEFLGFWRECYHQNRGVPYRVRPGEGAAVVRIIRDCGGLEIAKQAADRMIRSEDRWVRANTRIAILETHLNRFLEEDHGADRRDPVPLDAERQRILAGIGA